MEITKEKLEAAQADDFYHEWIKDTNETLVAKVDKHFGGWPVDYNQLLFFHGCEEKERSMRFGKDERNTGWWTKVLTDKDYYAVKLGFKEHSELAKLDQGLSRIMGALGHARGILPINAR